MSDWERGKGFWGCFLLLKYTAADWGRLVLARQWPRSRALSAWKPHASAPQAHISKFSLFLLSCSSSLLFIGLLLLSFLLFILFFILLLFPLFCSLLLLVIFFVFLLLCSSSFLYLSLHFSSLPFPSLLFCFSLRLPPRVYIKTPWGYLSMAGGLAEGNDITKIITNSKKLERRKPHFFFCSSRNARSVY